MRHQTRDLDASCSPAWANRLPHRNDATTTGNSHDEPINQQTEADQLELTGTSTFVIATSLHHQARMKLCVHLLSSRCMYSKHRAHHDHIASTTFSTTLDELPSNSSTSTANQLLLLQQRSPCHAAALGTTVASLNQDLITSTNASLVKTGFMAAIAVMEQK